MNPLVGTMMYSTMCVDELRVNVAKTGNRNCSTHQKIAEIRHARASSIESSCHVVEGISVGNEKKRATTSISGQPSAMQVSTATLEWLEQYTGYTWNGEQDSVQEPGAKFDE